MMNIINLEDHRPRKALKFEDHIFYPANLETAPAPNAAEPMASGTPAKPIGGTVTPTNSNGSSV